MKHHVDAGQEPVAEMRVADVAGHHLYSVERWQLFEPPPGIERVVLHERAHGRPLLHQALHEVGPDEAVGPRDENPLFCQFHESLDGCPPGWKRALQSTTIGILWLS